jgi:hypothetical protein
MTKNNLTIWVLLLVCAATGFLLRGIPIQQGLQGSETHTLSLPLPFPSVEFPL